MGTVSIKDLLPVRENINDMVFSSFIDKNLFSNSDQLKRLYVENNQVFRDQHTIYTLKYQNRLYFGRDCSYPRTRNNHIAQILGPEEAVWDLNKESVTYRTPTINAKISARVTNESAVVDNEGSLVRNRRSFIGCLYYGWTVKKVVDFEYLDFLRIKNNRIKSIFDNTGNLGLVPMGGDLQKQIQILSLNILQNKTPHSLNGIKSGVYTKISLGTYGSEQKVEGLVFRQTKQVRFFTSFNLNLAWG